MPSEPAWNRANRAARGVFSNTGLPDTLRLPLVDVVLHRELGTTKSYADLIPEQLTKVADGMRAWVDIETFLSDGHAHQKNGTGL